MKLTHRIKSGLLLWGVLVSTFFGIAFSHYSTVSAVNPTTIPFQGKVVNASGATNGTNVADGNYSFTFKLYSVSSGGVSIWGETQTTVAVTSGVFQVNLGSTCSLFTTQTCSSFSNTAIDFNANPTLYLGITFNGDAAGEMTPRMPLGSVPYAFNADKVGGLGAAQFVQLSVSQQTGSINVNGAITSAGTITGNLFSGSGASLTNFNPTNLVQGSGAATLQSAAATALTLTSNAAATWSTTGTNQLTLQSGSGTLSLGSTSALIATGALTIDSGSTTALNFGTGANAKTVTVGNTTTTSATTIDSGTGGINIGDDVTTKTIDIGGVTNSGTDTINIATNGTAADSISVGNANAATKIVLVAGPSTTTSGTAGIIIGSATTDATQTNLQLDSSSTFAEAGSTCATNVNQGALYYNTVSNSIRGCVNGGWEDMVSTDSLGLLLYGVVPDSGANPGDLAAVTGSTNGPCKVAVGSALTTVSWTGCIAYSGGRKVVVTAGTATATTTNGNFQHLCLTTVGTFQPALSASGTEIANLATVSLPSASLPIICLADIKTSSTAITTVFDTRTYTTTTKEFMALNSAAGIGSLVQFIATKGAVATVALANSNNLAGVVVATTGAASTTTENAIIATNGPAAVKAITGANAVAAYLFSSGTAGYATTVATKPIEATTTIYNLIGIARTAWSGGTTCVVSSDACAGSIFTTIDKR